MIDLARSFDAVRTVIEVRAGGECKDSKSCVNNATCRGTAENLQCLCDAEFVEEAGLCKVPDGGECMEASDCVDDALWTGTDGNRRCACNASFVADAGLCKIPNGGDCMQTSECVSNSSCTGTGNTRQCECDVGFVPDGGSCKATVGVECTDTSSCVLNASCLVVGGNRRCACDLGFVEEEGLCRRPKLGEECDPDGDPACEPILNGGECLSNGGGSPTCQCQSGYVSDDGACKKPLEGECKDSIDCVSNAACNTDSKCECNPGYIPEKTTGLCRKVNASLHEDCDPGEGACISPNAACVGDPGLEACTCKPGFVDNEDSCRLPSLGEDCIPAPGPGCEEIPNGECLGNEGGLATCKCLNAFVEDGGAC
ncbi:unnamed protein product [Darwinula stevensoni]|uniref:EGF-like domain-containing protein n=1 Tax=Darwinula stevensoni TaxID=69355 RepID=A0A7R9A6K4_9CRUS|nr:unnamed protein product [Darwinula stevensoni]CAG0894881.1 unnamed protein product [Darwinula stevensoni]